MAVSPYRKRGLSCSGILAQVRLCPYPKRARGRVQPGHSQLTLSVALFRGSGGFKGALGQAQAGARRRQSPSPTSKPLKAQPAWEYSLCASRRMPGPGAMLRTPLSPRGCPRDNGIILHKH